MTGPDASQQTPARPQGRHPLRRGARWLLCTILLLVVVALAAAAWLLGTESGLRTAAGLARKAGVEIEAPSGSLAGSLRLGRLHFASDQLVLDLRGLELDWRPSALLSGQLAVQRLRVAELDVSRRAAPDDESDSSLTAPDSLRLPLAVAVDSLEVDRFALRDLDDTAAPPAFSFETLRAAFHSDREHHRLDGLQIRLPFGDATLAAELGAASPFPLKAKASLAGQREAHDYRLNLGADGDLLAPRLQLQAEGVGMQGKGQVEATPFEPLPLRNLQLELSGLDPSRFAPEAPKARLDLNADLQAQATADGGMGLQGPVRLTNRQPDTWDRGGLPVDSLAGQLYWRGAEAGVDGLELRLSGGGRISGSASRKAPEPSPVPAGAPAADEPAAVIGQVLAALRLEGIDTSRLDSRLPRQRIGGSLRAEADDARQQAELALQVGSARLDGKVELQAEADGARRFAARTQLRSLDPSVVYPGAPSARLNLDLDASGRLAEPLTLDLAFAMPESRFQGHPLTGKGKLRLEGERLPLVDLALDVAGNKVAANGAWGGKDDRLTLNVDARALAALGYGLAGQASLQGEVRGGLEEPAGSMQLSANALALPGGLRIASAQGQGTLETGKSGRFALALNVLGVRQAGESGTLVDNANLNAQGQRDAHVIELAAEGLQHDTLSLRLKGGADAAASGPRWRGSLVRLEVGGRFPLKLEAPAALELAADRAQLATAAFSAGERGRIRLEETRWSPASSAVRGSLTGLVLDLAAMQDGRRRSRGALTLGAEWDLRLSNTLDGEARLFRESGDLRLDTGAGLSLGLETLDARLTAQANRLGLSFNARGSELGEVVGSASTQLSRTADGGWQLAPDAPLAGSATVSIPSIAWVGRLLEESVETAGSLNAEFSVGGTPAAPQAAGTIKGAGLQIALVDQGLILSGGELDAAFDRERLSLNKLAFVSPNRARPRDNRVPFARLTATPGTLEASGEVALESGDGRFQFSADRLPLLQRADRWLILSGKGEARTTWSSANIDAAFRADAGYLEMGESAPPALSEDVVVIGRNDRPAEEGEGFALTADVRVSLGDALYLSALGLDARLGGELRLRQQPGRGLSATGTVSTVDGSFRGYGQNLSIERGLVNFQGPVDNPGLNIIALRKGLAVEAGVAITGSARRPEVRLVSQPNVPDPEKLSWIVLGRAPDAAGGADLALLLPAAQALLGGPGGGMTEELTRSLGFDSFSIGQGELNSASRTATSQVAGGGSTVSDPTVTGQVLSVGKRLSSDLMLSFEQSLGGAETLVKLSYQLSRRVSLVARGGTDNALDVYYSLSFR